MGKQLCVIQRTLRKWNETSWILKRGTLLQMYSEACYGALATEENGLCDFGGKLKITEPKKGAYISHSQERRIRMCGEGAVQDVYIYKKGGVDTTYGKIVLKNTSICAAVLKSGGCDDEAKYYIGHGHVFLKKYERR
ncbi:hypothetical protein FXO38_21221 [Capsicum annuum]|nr:hypothetical protein FXO38_21221 [Capsicum annuum]KAF3681365.1 hypothetical protein FXO37_02942 [Capsicum annuum]